MIKDITIGQFFPGESVIHRLDARVKLILSFAFIVMLFAAKDAFGLAVSVVFMLGAFVLSGIPFSLMLKSLKPMIPILIFTAVLNLFFMKSGDVLFGFWKIQITTGGVSFTAFMLVRIIALIIGTSLLTYTTSPIDLTDAIERLFSPLKKIKVPVHELAMIMTIALRFIPTLIEETDKITSAQKARGAEIDSGGLKSRVKALVTIIIPLLVSSLRRAEELALAMECRCYHGGEGRTRMKQLKLGIRDAWASAVTAAFFTGVILLNVANLAARL
ncbi:MAG: energy-coupling factor transporter transmembrane component T [Oscillospiraceae bacterium]